MSQKILHKKAARRKWKKQLSDLKLSSVLLSLHLPSRQIEPCTASEGRRDSFLAPQPHLIRRRNKISPNKAGHEGTRVFLPQAKKGITKAGTVFRVGGKKKMDLLLSKCHHLFEPLSNCSLQSTGDIFHIHTMIRYLDTSFTYML